ncbi:Uncharacterized protein QTN25_006460 [Entamoeba marina]
MANEQDVDLKEVLKRQHEILLKMKKERGIMEKEIQKLKEEKREWLVEKEELKGDVQWRDEALAVREELGIVAEELETCQKQNIMLRRENDSLRSVGEEAQEMKEERKVLEKKVEEYESRIFALVKVVEKCKNQVSTQVDQKMKMQVKLDEIKLSNDQWNSQCLRVCQNAGIDVDPTKVVEKLVEALEEVRRMKIQVDDYKFRYNRAIERMTEHEQSTAQQESDDLDMIE